MRRVLPLAAALTFIAGAALAFGPHDNNCTECHSLHYAKGRAIIGVAPKADKVPTTGKPASEDIPLCLGCHNDDEGIMPILLTSTHPVGLKPAKVQVPEGMLSKDGTLSCMGCHDPHPSNPNYKYLRGEVSKASEMGKFCAICHKEKVDMNEFVPKKVVVKQK